MFGRNPQEQEEMDFTIDGPGEVDRYDAALTGSQHPDQAWILSDRDVWYANPYYTGPAEPHPDFEDFEDYVAPEPDFARLEAEKNARLDQQANDDEIPF